MSVSRKRLRHHRLEVILGSLELIADIVSGTEPPLSFTQALSLELPLPSLQPVSLPGKDIWNDGVVPVSCHLGLQRPRVVLIPCFMQFVKNDRVVVITNIHDLGVESSVDKEAAK